MLDPQRSPQEELLLVLVLVLLLELVLLLVFVFEFVLVFVLLFVALLELLLLLVVVAIAGATSPPPATTPPPVSIAARMEILSLRVIFTSSLRVAGCCPPVSHANHGRHRSFLSRGRSAASTTSAGDTLVRPVARCPDTDPTGAATPGVAMLRW